MNPLPRCSGTPKGAGTITVPSSSGVRRASRHEFSMLDADGQTLIGRCMHDYGLRFWAALVSTPSPEVLFPYLLTDLAWAEQYGHGSALVRTKNTNKNNLDYSDRLRAFAKMHCILDLNDSGSAGPGTTVSLLGGGAIGRSLLGCTAKTETDLQGNYVSRFKSKSLVQDLTFLTDNRVMVSLGYHRSVESGPPACAPRPLTSRRQVVRRSSFLRVPVRLPSKSPQPWTTFVMRRAGSSRPGWLGRTAREHLQTSSLS